MKQEMPKTPKGTVDASPKDALLYETLIEKTRSTFQLYGAVPIDTPVFELKSVLMNKYGEDTKLIYDLKDDGGEICALRYDLTVPFSRYMCMNKLKKLKRYQIGKVYRRDKPSVVKGRMREFWQADFDIAGEGSAVMIDSELLNCVNRLLSVYEIGPYRIRISDRRLLFGIMEVCGIETSLYGTIASTIDKMDKLSIEEINQEMLSKGLNDIQVRKLNRYISICGNEEVLDMLENDEINRTCGDCIKYMRQLFSLCRIMGFSDNLYIDLSLARGLDYYTGLILEGIYTNQSTGSVVGGGRYDGLIGNLGSSGIVPCAGFSIGLTRIWALLKDKYNTVSSTDVFISASGGLLLEERLRLLNLLWNAGIKSETFYTARTDLKSHKSLCTKKHIRYLVVVGEKEWLKGMVALIDMQTEIKIEVSIDSLPEKIGQNK